MIEYFLFLHIAGLIIGLGAVTVIDVLGFLSRKSRYWTKITIGAHHVTKPLIWAGILLTCASWIYLYQPTQLGILKTGLLLALITNGCFLSFYVSPKLDKTKGLFDKNFQKKITISVIISFICWWSVVLITINTIT